MMTSARNIERERSLQLNREGKVLVQSQEGAINVVPRPRIKIPDGMGEIMDSQQSEAMAPENKRMNTEGHDLSDHFVPQHRSTNIPEIDFDLCIGRGS